ncbi:hypothetical protein TWF281_004256 [Arthrobotrys megalospora]
MICVPINIGQSDPNAFEGGGCQFDISCHPTPAANRQDGSNSFSNPAIPAAYTTYRFKRDKDLENRQDTETPSTIITTGPTVTVYLPQPPFSQTTHRWHPPYAYPHVGGGVGYTQPPFATYPPDPYSEPTDPEAEPDPYHPGTADYFYPSKPCRIPKTYQGVCHPIVIPAIVLTTYILATYILYNGDSLNCCSPNLPPPPSAPLPAHFLNRETGIYIYPPVATVDNGFRNNLMWLITCFCGEPAGRNRSGGNDGGARDRINQTACYFLTTMLTYGAGLIVLGAFLGGLCNCVKSECEFK